MADVDPSKLNHTPPENNAAATTSQSKLTCTTANYAQGASMKEYNINPWINNAAPTAAATTAATTTAHINLTSPYAHHPTAANLLGGMQPADFGFSNEQFNHLLMRNAPAVERAAAYAFQPAAASAAAANTTSSVLKRPTTTAAAASLAGNNNTTTAPAAPLNYHHVINPALIEDSVFARYALRAMNGGHEPNGKQIIEFMSRMQSSGASAAATAATGTTSATATTATAVGGGGVTIRLYKEVCRCHTNN